MSGNDQGSGHRRTAVAFLLTQVAYNSVFDHCIDYGENQ